ncbi:MAG TPA: S8 family serine peptidase [Anaerolineales bacterium]
MHNYRLPSAILLILIIFSLPIAGATARAPSRPGLAEIIPGEVVLAMRPQSSLQSLSLPEGVSVSHTSRELSLLNSLVMRVPAGQETAFAGRLNKLPGVLFAEPNYRVQAALIPDDPKWAQQYGPAHLKAPAAWDVTTGSAAVIVAIVDSGIDSAHPEFAGRLLPGVDFVDSDNTPQDLCGHGTHVAGILAARGNNQVGIAGIAWQTSLLPVRVLDGYCNGSTASVAEGLVWAAERGARVINLSLGTPVPSTLLENGSYYAYTHGAALFAAAGNSGTSPVVYPAAYPWVMAVGATDQSDARAGYSNTGAALDLMAPGSKILSTTPLGSFYYKTAQGVPSEYGVLSGTSMATAHASGAAALLASLPAFDTPDKIYQALTLTSLDLDVPGRDDRTGYGLIQIDAALAFNPHITPTPPPPTPATTYALLNNTGCGNLVQYKWRDAASAGFSNYLPVFGNDGFATVSMPFTFTFGNVAYANLTVSANGYLTFGGDGSLSDNFIIPSIAQPNNFIAPFWDDLNPSAGGVIAQATLGTAPNREFVIEWNRIPRFSVPNSALTFEVVLFEGTGQILLQYKDLSGAGSDGSSATIGVEFAAGRDGTEFSYNKPGAVTPGTALLLVPYPTGTASPAEGCSAFTRNVGTGGGFFEAPPFCVSIPQNALQHPAVLQIRLLNSAPALPAGYLDLHHFADVNLAFSPAPPLGLFPEIYICYHYTNSDVLAAGGHPENLLIAAYDHQAGRWDLLPTTADLANGLIMARIQHFSYFGVTTLAAPNSRLSSSNSRQPVTGAPFAWDTATCLPPFLFLFILGCLFLWRKRSSSSGKA